MLGECDAVWPTLLGTRHQEVRELSDEVEGGGYGEGGAFNDWVSGLRWFCECGYRKYVKGRLNGSNLGVVFLC